MHKNNKNIKKKYINYTKVLRQRNNLEEIKYYNNDIYINVISIMVTLNKSWFLLNYYPNKMCNNRFFRWILKVYIYHNKSKLCKNSSKILKDNNIRKI